MQITRQKENSGLSGLRKGQGPLRSIAAELGLTEEGPVYEATHVYP